jgi:hypothetical protein
LGDEKFRDLCQMMAEAPDGGYVTEGLDPGEQVDDGDADCRQLTLKALCHLLSCSWREWIDTGLGQWLG